MSEKNKPIKKQTWSNIDVFGLLSGLSIWDSQYKNLKYIRKPFESTKELRNRIINNSINKPGVDKQGLLNGISNEFNILPYNLNSKSIFELTYSPIIKNELGQPDIEVYYKDKNNGEWINLTQMWIPSENGFMVWSREYFKNNPDTNKNFTYTNILQIFSELEDETELKIVYWIKIIEEEKTKIISFTDINQNNNDSRFTYRKDITPDRKNVVSVYNLSDIPNDLINKFYEVDGSGTNLLYKIKDYINNRFKHKWNEIHDRSCIWDVRDYYGYGEIPHFYDAYVPRNNKSIDLKSNYYNIYSGGIQHQSKSLYCMDIVDNNNEWNMKLYPGKFYLKGIPFYLFENPIIQELNIGVNALGIFDLPAGLLRGMYTIASKNITFFSTDNDSSFNSIVYEDYDYEVGSEIENNSNILRRIPCIDPDIINIPIPADSYRIDFENNKIYAPGLSVMSIVWDNTLVPNGKIIPYDINPINDGYNESEKFFVYISVKDNTINLPSVKVGNLLFTTSDYNTSVMNDGTLIKFNDLSGYDGTDYTEFSRDEGYPLYSIVNGAHVYNGYAIVGGLKIPNGWRIPTLADIEYILNQLHEGGHRYDGDTTPNHNIWNENGLAKAISSKESRWHNESYGYYTTGNVGLDPHLNNSSGLNLSPNGYRYIWHESTDALAFYWINTLIEDQTALYTLQTSHRYSMTMHSPQPIWQGHFVRLCRDV